MPGIYFLSVIWGPVNFPPSSQCTEEYFRIIRMAWVTTKREGGESYRSDVHRFFKYNQHGPGDNQERRREIYRSDVHRIFKYNGPGPGDNQERRREKL
jgi:hypothetical protein